MTPDRLAVEAWYLLAVLRVYGPWLGNAWIVPDGELRFATGRVEYARLWIAQCDPLLLAPPAVVAFNKGETCA